MIRSLALASLFAVGACAPAPVPLADLPGKRLALRFDNDGLISSPAMLEVQGELSWDEIDAETCPRVAGLLVGFAGRSFEAYDHGGKVVADDGTSACFRAARFTALVDVSAIRVAEAATVVVSDGESTVSAEVAAPAASRVLSATSASSPPRSGVRLAWSPSTDVLPGSAVVSLHTIGSAAPVEAEIDGATLSFVLPDAIGPTLVHAVAEIEEVGLPVTACEGLESCAATMHLFHRAEGDLLVRE